MFDTLKKIFGKHEIKTQDVLDVYPANVHVPAFPERRYLWTMRFMAIICIWNLCAANILAAALPIVAAKKRADYVLAHYVESKDKILPIREDTIRTRAVHNYQEKLTIEYLRGYFTTTDDSILEIKKWKDESDLSLYTSDRLRGKFEKDKKTRIEELINEGLTKDIRIINIEGPFYNNYIFEVYRSTTNIRTGVTNYTYGHILLNTVLGIDHDGNFQIQFTSRRLSDRDKWNNPLNFTVLKIIEGRRPVTEEERIVAIEMFREPDKYNPAYYDAEFYE